MNKGTQKDLKNKVNMDQVLGGYFGDVGIAQSFIEIGIAPIQHQLAKKIRIADFGGGQGLLLSIVRDYLVAQGFMVEAYVVDSNPEFIKECEKKNLQVVLSDIRDCPLEGLDLIIMRAVLHYNAVHNQIKILNGIKKSLAPSGKLVAQILTGSEINCSLRKEIISLPSLGEEIFNGYYICQHFEQLEQTLGNIGFATVEKMGAAPSLRWSLENQWVRFNGPLVDSKSGLYEQPEDKLKMEKFMLFKEQVNLIIQNYSERYGRDQLNIDFKDNLNPIIQNDYQIYCLTNV
jgi:SAM-dependent methyltransferase